jgi:hypothetical protein
MTYEEFCARLDKAAPGCAVEELDNGELVVYTGHACIEDDGLEPVVRKMSTDEVIAS